VSGEKGHQVGNAPVVNVCVGCFHAPYFGIFAEIRFHVFVYFLLQVNAHFPVCPYNHIRTNAFIRRNIAVGIRNLKISRIVPDFLFCQGEGRIRQSVEKDALPDCGRERRHEKGEMQKQSLHGFTGLINPHLYSFCLRLNP
jgi:hypothetical protein